jgi:hypothetical protein
MNDLMNEIDVADWDAFEAELAKLHRNLNRPSMSFPPRSVSPAEAGLGFLFLSTQD